MKRIHLLLAITLLAAALRLYDLGEESFWLDEGILLERIEEPYMTQLVDRDAKRQGPIFGLLEKAWHDVAGNSEAILRFPAAVFGILCVPAVYLLAAELFNPAAGLYAALFMAVNPFGIYHSQDMRPYTLFLLLSILSLYYLSKYLREDIPRNKWKYVLTTLVALYSHAYSPFLLLAHLLIILKNKPQPFKPYFSAARFIFLGYLPMLLVFGYIFVKKIENPAVAAAWVSKPDLYQLIYLSDKFFQDTLFSHIIVYFLLGTLVLCWRKILTALPKLSWLLLFGFAMVFIPWLISYLITPIYVARFVIPALAIYMIALGVAVTQYPKWLTVLIVALLIAGHLPILQDYYTKVDKDPWKQAAKELNPRLKTGDLIVSNTPQQVRCMSYYFNDSDSIPIISPKSPEQAASAIEGANRIWLVRKSYRDWGGLKGQLTSIVGENHVLTDSLNVMDFIEVNPKANHIAEIQLLLYEPKPQSTP